MESKAAEAIKKRDKCFSHSPCAHKHKSSLNCPAAEIFPKWWAIYLTCISIKEQHTSWKLENKTDFCLSASTISSSPEEANSIEWLKPLPTIHLDY